MFKNTINPTLRDIDLFGDESISIERIRNYIRLLSTLPNTSLTSKHFKTGFNRLYLVVGE